MPSIKQKHIAAGEFAGMQILHFTHTFAGVCNRFNSLGMRIPCLDRGEKAATHTVDQQRPKGGLLVYGFGGVIRAGTSLSDGNLFGIQGRQNGPFDYSTDVASGMSPAGSQRWKMPAAYEFSASGKWCFHWFDSPWILRATIATDATDLGSDSWPFQSGSSVCVIWYNEPTGGASKGTAEDVTLDAVAYCREFHPRSDYRSIIPAA